jgi:hypothetical protein
MPPVLAFRREALHVDGQLKLELRKLIQRHNCPTDCDSGSILVETPDLLIGSNSNSLRPGSNKINHLKRLGF